MIRTEGHKICDTHRGLSEGKEVMKEGFLEEVT